MPSGRRHARAPFPRSCRMVRATSALESETCPHHALGERRAQVESPRQRRKGGAVDVTGDSSRMRIRRLRPHLQEAPEVSGDRLHVAPADSTTELVPIEPEVRFFLGTRAPEKWLADASLG